MLGADLKLYPISFPDQSDTATFDSCLELLTMAGYPISQAVMMIPEPWGSTHPDGRAPPRAVLRIPRRHDGTLGRPGGHRVH